MNNKKKYECKNLGCRNIFDLPMLLARHSKKCIKPQPVEEKKMYIEFKYVVNARKNVLISQTLSDMSKSVMVKKRETCKT